MTNELPEPLETQFRKAGDARQLFSPQTFLGVTLGSLVLDVLLVAGGWVVGSPSRIAFTLVGIDALLLGAWIIGIPFRRWLARSPY
jgi:hypothetical protein